MKKALTLEQKARRAAYQRQYRQDHKSKIAAQQKQYNQNHKAKIAAQKKQWKKDHEPEVTAYKKQYQQDNRIKIAARAKRYRQNHRAEDKHNKLMRAYGIGLEQYDELFLAQGGRCAICGKHQTELPRALAVDHNHETGEVRGLLCSKCNTSLVIVENRELLASAMRYLQAERAYQITVVNKKKQGRKNKNLNVKSITNTKNMKTIETTPATIAIAMDEMKQALNEYGPGQMTEENWDLAMKDFRSGFIADAVAEIDTPLLKNKWLAGAYLD